jgi:CRP/FNR family transcriptional regulator, cyclic AMP receptor protein
MNQKKTDYLNQVDALQDLSDIEIEQVSDQTHMVDHRQGHIFYMPDDPGDVLFILKKGRIQLYRMSPDGRKLIFVILHPGAIFGNMALVGQHLHQTYAQAVDDCTICVWNREQVEEMFIEKPQIAFRFLEAVGNRLSQVEERLADVTFQPIATRLATLLIRLDREDDSSGKLKGYTHQYLADMLGTYRETTTQVLNQFKAQSLIQTGRKTIEILDIKGLEEIATSSE